MLTDSETLKLYMVDISQYPLVSPVEEVSLAAEIAAGSEDARAKLIRANLRLVVKLAHDFKGFGLPLLDLISEGNIGLMRAVEKFDPSKGAKLSSYAAWWIKQAMRRAINNQARTIRVPLQAANKLRTLHGARIRLAEEHGREPTESELAEATDMSERTVMSLRVGRATVFSLDAPISDSDDSEFRDLIPDENSATPDVVVQDAEILERVQALIPRLDDRERTILVKRFGLDGERPQTLKEVSQAIGRTHERGRQIQNQALERLRTMLLDEGFLSECG